MEILTELQRIARELAAIRQYLAQQPRPAPAEPEASLEAVLMAESITPGTPESGLNLMATQIRTVLERDSKLLLSLKAIGAYLKANGFICKSVRHGEEVRQCYFVNMPAATANYPHQHPFSPKTPKPNDRAKRPASRF